MNQYKIFIVSYVYDKFVKGDMGGHRKVLELAENFKKLGHSVGVFIADYERCSDSLTVDIVRVPTIKARIIRPISFGFFLFFKMLAKSIKKKPNFIYCRPITSLMPLIFSKLLNAKIFFETNNNPYQRMRKRILSRYYFNWVINHINFNLADGIISINNAVKRLVMEYHSIKENKISVINNCTNTEHFKPLDKLKCRQELNINDGYFVAGFVGTLFFYQGINLLIDAVPAISKIIGNIHFLILGDGEAKTKWQEDARAKGVEKYFTFTGQVPYLEVPKYINAMDICLAPLLSNRDEASPLKIFDCMSCGKPVIVSDIKPLEELIKQIKELVAFKADDANDLADKIIILAKQPEKINELGEKSRAYILNGHSWSDNVNKLVYVYESIKK